MKCKVSDVAVINSQNFNFRGVDYVNYLDTGSITNNHIDSYQKLQFGVDAIPSRAKRSVRKNTIVYSCVRPRLCHYGILKDVPQNVVVSTGFATIDAIESKIDPDYLYCLLTTKDRTEYLAKIADTAASSYPAISPDDLADLEIDIVEDLKEQKKIANILMELETKISNNQTINAELEAMAKTIYDYWFLQFEFPDENGKPYKSSGGKMVYNEELKREIPEGWEVKMVTEYCRIFTGKKDVNQSLNQGLYKFFSCAPEYRYSNEKLYEGKAILISGNGSYTGRTIFVNDAFDLYQRTYACVNNTDNDVLIYIYYTMLKFFVARVSGGTHGSAIPYIVYNDIADEMFAFDDAVVSKFIGIVETLQLKILENQKENQELASLRDFLLPLLMNGQVGFKEEV